MQKTPYEILGLSEGASLEEIEAAYEKLRAEFVEKMFLEGEAGNAAARRVTEIDNAYRDLKAELESSHVHEDSFRVENVYDEIERLIKAGQVNDAQDKLDNLAVRDATWHYYQSIIFYRKKWYLDSKKQLEMAVSQDPDNKRYRDALERLNRLLNGELPPQGGPEEQARRQQQQAAQAYQQQQQMGATDDCLSSCAQCLMCNLLCNCCCR